MSYVKGFVIAYAQYRRLGFSEVESIDFAMSKPSVAPILAARARRDQRARDRRAQLRVVK